MNQHHQHIPAATPLLPAPVFSTTGCVNMVPEAVWRHHFIKMLGLKELSILRRTNTFFQPYWREALNSRTIRVPQDRRTIQRAVKLANILSVRIQYTTLQPLRIVIDEGEYPANGGKCINVNVNHVAFVGKGPDKTFIVGGFYVANRQITFEGLSISAPRGCGLSFNGRETMVIVSNCDVQKCRGHGMFVETGAIVTATRCNFFRNGAVGLRGYGVHCHDRGLARLNDCTMHHNDDEGLFVSNASVHLYGQKTEIYCNQGIGMYATKRGLISIHLPTTHNTSHDNTNHDQQENGLGSIANINADGTFTHYFVHGNGAIQNVGN
jgi:hypothetical protein